MKNISVTLDQELIAKLDVIAKELDTDRSKFIRHAIRNYLNTLKIGKKVANEPVDFIKSNYHNSTK